MLQSRVHSSFTVSCKAIQVDVSQLLDQTGPLKSEFMMKMWQKCGHAVLAISIPSCVLSPPTSVVVS
jgi:hypothetical protein